MNNQRPILFYDGVCGLCHGLIQFILAHDRRKVLCFAQLQGKLASEKIEQTLRDDLSTVVLLDDGGQWQKSDAVLKALILMGAPWSSVGRLLFIFPRPLRNIVYDLVARYRYKVFGQYEICKIPSTEEKNRLVD